MCVHVCVYLKSEDCDGILGKLLVALMSLNLQLENNEYLLYNVHGSDLVGYLNTKSTIIVLQSIHKVQF